MKIVFWIIKAKSIFMKILFKMFRNMVFYNVNNSKNTQNCLLVYITEPFFMFSNDHGHQNRWQVQELARIVGDYGFNVDVVNYFNIKAKYKHKYNLIIDIHPGFNSSYAEHLVPNALKISYITGSNPVFSNRVEMERLENLEKRRGILLKQRRYAMPFNKDIFESFDAMFFIGNQYNLITYNEFNLKKVFFIKNTGYTFLKPDDCSRKSPKNFLFFASVGQVHKGLDLLLEVFSKRKDLNLYVCSDFEREKDFCVLFEKELFKAPNIFPLGFLDIKSAEFREVCSICSYVVLPSCSEGVSGSVLTAMSAGLIPIVSRECGFTEDEAFIFEKCDVVCIASTLDVFSKKKTSWIIAESEKCQKVVENNYSQSDFSESVRQAMEKVLVS